jgi:hypothetical protein
MRKHTVLTLKIVRNSKGFYYWEIPGKSHTAELFKTAEDALNSFNTRVQNNDFNFFNSY